MKLFKKISVIILAIIATFSFSMFVACSSPTGSGNKPPVVPPKQELITFDKTTLDMVVGDEAVLLATAHSYQGVEFTYESSNNAIVSIDDFGRVTANGQGVASVYAKYGTEQAECVVTVTHGNLLPSITINNLGDTLVVPKTIDYALNPYVTFNGKKFTNATFTYEQSNNNISIDQATGVITGVSIGETLVTVKASWDGVSGIATMSKTFTVKVTNTVEMYINGGSTSSITLYNKVLNKLGGEQTSKNADFNVVAKDANGPLTPEITVVEGNNVVVYEEGVLKGQGVLGTAKVKVAVEVDGESFELFVDVTCERAVGDYMASNGTEYKTIDFDTLTGEIDVADIFGDATTLTDGKLGRTELSINNNKIISGIPGDAFSANPEKKIITIYDNDEGYNVEIVPYVFKNATVIDKKYQLSTYDGQLFNENFELVGAEDIFGAGAQFKEAYLLVDGVQQKLPLSDDFTGILDVKSAKEFPTYQLAVACADDMIKVEIDAYTLVLDTMMDFDYFIVKDGSWGYERSTKWTIYSGMDWTGSYVLANDIDASEYYSPNAKYPDYFNGLDSQLSYLGWDNVTYQKAHFGSRDVIEIELHATMMGLAGKGMQGIFDGRGHVIKNYEPQLGGLFQIVNNGIVRNLGFTNLKAGGHGAVTAKLINGSLIENCFFQVNPEKSYKGLYSGSIAFGAISKTSMMKNIVVINESEQVPTTSTAGALFHTTSEFSDNNETVVVVSPQPVFFAPNKTTGGITTRADAKMVDGVELSADITTIPNVYRYSSFDKLAQDKAFISTKLSGFNTDYFTLIDNNMPVMTSALTPDDFEIYVGEYKASELGSFITKTEDVDISVRYRGILYSYVDSIVKVSDDQNVVTINGYSINGSKSGSATLLASFEFKGQTITKEFKVNSVSELQDYTAKTYYYSAIDGVFFEKNQQEQLVVVDHPLTEIFGKSTDYADLFVAFDNNGQAIEIDTINGRFKGIATDRKDYLDTYIDIYTDEIGKRVEIRSAGLIIDQASDLEYFKIKEEFRRITTPYIWVFGEGDFTWDSYYVLANNIDASEYGIHDVENGMIGEGSNRENLRWTPAASIDYNANTGIKNGVYLHGLIGTLDGNGYVISNLTTEQSGLFGIIGDAVIKNLGLVNCKVVDNKGGVLAWAIGGATRIENVYVETTSDAIGANYAPLASTLGVNLDINGLYIVDKTSLRTDTLTTEYLYGSFTSSVDRYSNAAGTMKNPLTYNKAFQNVIIVSNKAMQATVYANVNGSAQHKVGHDAAYIDGVENTTKTTIPFDYYNKTPGITQVEVDPIPGIRRYTSIDALKTDATANADLLAGFNAPVWKVENGEIIFKQRENVYITLAKLDGVLVGESVAKPVGATIIPSLNVNGVDAPATAVEILSGNEFATIEGSNIKLGGIEGAVTVKITAGNATQNVIIHVQNPVINFGDVVATENGMEIMLAQTKAFNVTFGGVALHNVVLDTAESTDLVTIDGLNVTASASKSGVVELRLTVNGVAFVYNVNVVSPDIMSKGTAITNNKMSLISGESTTITFSYNNAEIVGTPVLTTTSSAVTIDGSSITANDITGDSEVVTINATLNGMIFNFEITVYSDAEQVDLEPYFSAHDGEFFNTELTGALSLDQVLGETDATIISARDADGNVLLVKDNKIYGLKTGKALKEIQLTIYTTVKAYKVNVKAYTLIIDTLEDFNNYFKVDLAYTGAKETTNNVPYLADQGKWDGYYMLITDLVGNGTGSSASLGHNLGYSYGNLSVAAIEQAAADGVTNDIMTNGVYTKGLTGVFDGNGHEVNNLKMHLGGMFGVVLGGTVKNLKITNAGFAYDAAIAQVIAGGATLENIHVVNTMTERYRWQPIAREIGTATVSNVVVEAPNLTIKNYAYYVYTGSFANVSDSTVVENVIIVSPIETLVNHNTSVRTTVQDAAILNGVANANETGKKINGIRRYTSYADLRADANNIDWTAWNSSVWEVIDSVPSFVSRLTDSYALTVNGLAYDSNTKLELEEGDQVTFGVIYDGKALIGQPTATIVAGEDYVSLDGLTLTANADSSSGNVAVTIAYRNYTWTVNVEVWPTLVPEDYETELQFSAYNGLFYNGSSIVSIDDIFGGDVTVTRAIDADGNRLTVSDGAILDLKLGKINDYKDTTITLYTAEKALKIKVKAATLIIDGLDTFNSYFKITTCTKVSSSDATFVDGEFEWDGYYVMVNDIVGDGLGSKATKSHNLQNLDTLKAADIESQSAAKTSNGIMTNGEYVKGLTGTFDGNGYKVSNLKMYTGGLFCMVLGGTVKNLKIENSGYKYNDLIANVIGGGATIKDVYIVSNITDAYNMRLVAKYIGTATIDNVYIEALTIVLSHQGYYTNTGSLGNVTENTVLTDVVIVSPLATVRNHYKNKSTGAITDVVLQDAQYVDGVLNETTGITIANGVRRYNSIEALKLDVNKINWTGWDSAIWEIVDGKPQFVKTLTGGYSILVDGASIDVATKQEVEVEDQSTVTVTLNGATVAGKPTLTILEGADYVTINGNVITAKAESGESAVKVKVDYRSTSWELSFVVYPNIIVEDHPEEYQFSAHDGLFFNGDTVVSLDEILGAGVTVSRAFDANGNRLTVQDGKVLGMDLGEQDTWVKTSITLYTSEKAVKVYVNAADLIIDEAKDLSVFSFNGDVFVDGIIVANESFIWDGYYVVVKDIDAMAQGYVHISATEEIDHASNISVDTVSESKVGLSGTFDGQGHTISNLMINSYVASSQNGSGLFTFINGGVVKNVNFNKISTTKSIGTVTGATNVISNTGALATYLVNNAVIENIYLTFYGVAGGSSARVLYHTATAGCEVKNSVIDYQSNFDPLTSTSGVHNANGGGLYAKNSATFTNVYYISDLCLVVGGRGATNNTVVNKETKEVVKIGANAVRWRKVGTDALYVDDVASTTVNYVLADTQGTQYHFDKFDIYTGENIALNSAYEITTLTGVKRYTSLTAMADNWENNEQGSALRNDFSSWDTKVWTISAEGIPSMHVVTNA